MKKNLATMTYPGRVIIIGKSPKKEDIIMYAITGRSPSSQARKLEVSGDQKQIFVKPTDEKILNTGDPALLIYPAIIIHDGIAVSNGIHTKDIVPFFRSRTNPADVLVNGLSNWEYEPDEPNFTPRISGCVFNGAGLSIIRRANDGSAERNYFEIPLIPKRGKMIATYTGINKNPLPPFIGEPIDIDMPYKNAEDAVEAMYEALGPGDGADDFRVAAAAVYCDKYGKISIALRNRH